MIGIYVSKEQVFPILVKDFTGGDHTYDEYKIDFAKDSPTYNHLKNKKTKKKTMQYSPESPEIELRPQIKTLFQRLATIYKQFENKAREIDSIGGDKYKIGSTIFSTKMMSKTKFNNLNFYDTKFLPLYYQRISNSCQLNTGKPIPDGGDCGFTLLSSILLSTPVLTSEQILLRQTMNIFLFPN